MAKKYKYKKHIKSKQVQQEVVPAKKNRLPYIIILLFTFLLYGNTLTNQYALDDSIVILDNQFTKEGFAGIKDILKNDTFTGFFGIQKNLVAGGRYRPLSLVTFAIEYEIFGKNPFIGHLINILLYALTGMILFSILKKLLQKYDTNRKWYFSISFIASILFIAHPIHTEVIANIKGRDEIMTLLGSLTALFYTIRYLETKKSFYLLASSLVFFLALLSKENAITFLAIIPVSIYFFTTYKFKQNIISLLPLIFASIVFLVIRQKMLGTFNIPETYELMNNPYIHADGIEKMATIIYTWGIYLKLLVFPHPLTFDYYPKHIPIINFGDYRALISTLFYAAIAIIGIIGIKKKKLISFSILFFAFSFSIVSNLFFNVGAFMNERFMYISSIGFCLILAYILIIGLQKLIKSDKNYRTAITSILIIVIALYSFKTIDRNTVWDNDYILFSTDIKISENSAKSTCSAGGKIMEEAIKLRKIKSESTSFNNIKRKIKNETSLSNKEKNRILDSGNFNKAGAEIDKMEQEMLQLSLKYLNKAIEIHPTYIDAILLLGNAHFEYNKNYEKTVEMYLKILRINPNYDRAFSNMEIVFNSCEDIDLKIKTWEEVYKLNSNRFEVNYYLGNLYGRFKNNTKKAIPFLEKAVQIKPNNAKAYKDLGVAYGISQMFNKSIPILEKAIQLDPKDAQIMVNLGVTYRLTGNEEKAIECFNRAKEIDPNFQIPQ